MRDNDDDDDDDGDSGDSQKRCIKVSICVVLLRIVPFSSMFTCRKPKEEEQKKRTRKNCVLLFFLIFANH